MKLSKHSGTTVRERLKPSMSASGPPSNRTNEYRQRASASGRASPALVGVVPLLLTLPLDAAHRVNGLGFSASLRRSGRIGEFDPANYRDRRRVAALPQVDPDGIARPHA